MLCISSLFFRCGPSVEDPEFYQQYQTIFPNSEYIKVIKPYRDTTSELTPPFCVGTY